MKQITSRVVASILASLLIGCGQATEEAQTTLAFYGQEMLIVDRLQALSEANPAGRYAFRHANIVDVVDGRIVENMRVDIMSGQIEAIAPDSEGNVTDSAVTEIDARGLYLAPGLADMHVHQLLSADVHLLNLASGVTTVRDLDGYDWMLRWREQSRKDEWIAPDMIVTGTIIATYPMGIYAIVVETEDEARELVRKQVADGYDYIKIHNNLPIGLYDVIMDEARRNDIGVVGHVPHDISVAHALGQGQETLEHLKGYINDRNLQINTDDWVTPTRTSSAWNVPTLYTHRQYTRGESARDFFASDEARYIPIGFRETWRKTMDDSLRPVFADELDNRVDVIRQLLPVTHRFLAGTDSGSGSEYMVPGFALHTELDMLQSAGLSTLETIRSATLYAAQATGREQDFGRIAVGLRASLVLLDENPLQDQDKLRWPAGVMLRGRWFTREVLETEMNWLADLYARQPKAIDADVLVAEIEQLVSEAYVFPTHQLAEIAAALVTLDHHELAGRINALQ